MKAPPKPSTVVAIILVIPTVYVLAIWYVLLFVGQPPEGTWLGQLRYIFSAANDYRWWYVWFAALPIVCISHAALYALGFAAKRTWARGLFATTTSVALVNFVFTAWMPAFLTALPIYWAFLCLRPGHDSVAPGNA